MRIGKVTLSFFAIVAFLVPHVSFACDTTYCIPVDLNNTTNRQNVFPIHSFAAEQFMGAQVNSLRSFYINTTYPLTFTSRVSVAAAGNSIARYGLFFDPYFIAQNKDIEISYSHLHNSGSCDLVFFAHRRVTAWQRATFDRVFITSLSTTTATTTTFSLGSPSNTRYGSGLGIEIPANSTCVGTTTILSMVDKSTGKPLFGYMSNSVPLDFSESSSSSGGSSDIDLSYLWFAIGLFLFLFTIQVWYAVVRFK